MVAIVPTTAATEGSDGPNQIEAHSASPNPNNGSGWVALKLKGSVDSVELKVYTKSMALVGISGLGRQMPGWTRVPLPGELQPAQRTLLLPGRIHAARQREF